MVAVVLANKTTKRKRFFRRQVNGIARCTSAADDGGGRKISTVLSYSGKETRRIKYSYFYYYFQYRF